MNKTIATEKAQTMAVRFLSVNERLMVREMKVGMTPMGFTTDTKPADSCK